MARVLLVEGSPTQALILGDRLHSAGFEVQLARDGESALRELRQGRFDAVLCDFFTPGLSAVEICQAIRAISPSLPVAILSSQADEESAARALEAGADGFFPKHFEHDLLSPWLRSVLPAVRPRQPGQCNVQGVLVYFPTNEQALDYLEEAQQPHRAYPCPTLTPAPDPDQETGPSVVRLQAGSGRAGVAAWILVVEDCAVNRMIIEDLILEMGNCAIITENGQQALEMWEAQPFDLMLVDSEMPIMGGVDCVRELRRREAAQGGSRIPIVGLTAHEAPKRHQDFLQAGADRVLIKPLERLQLQGLLEELHG